EFDTQIKQRGYISGCRFFTEGSLPDPYPGQYYYPSWPTSADIPYDQGFAAVYIAGAAGLNIGFVGALGADRNKIFNMRNGVVMMYAVADIAGTDFYDFEGAQSKLLGDPLLDLNQYGIHNFFAASKIEQNTMYNLMVGIRSDMSMMRVRGNIIETLLAPETVSGTRCIEVTRPQTLHIEHNYLYEGYYGIWVRDATTRFDIRSNTMERKIPAAGNSAIELVNCTASVINDGVVKGNN